MSPKLLEEQASLILTAAMHLLAQACFRAARAVADTLWVDGTFLGNEAQQIWAEKLLYHLHAPTLDELEEMEDGLYDPSNLPAPDDTVGVYVWGACACWVGGDKPWRVEWWNIDDAVVRAEEGEKP